MYLRKILVLIAILGLLFCGIKVYDIMSVFSETNTAFNNKEAYVYIPSNADYAYVRQELAPLLNDVASFDIVAEKKGYNTNISSGKFTITNGMNTLAILNTLSAKSDAITITITKGESLANFISRVAKQIEPNKETLHDAFADSLFLQKHALTTTTIDSILKPHSYLFSWDVSAEKFRNIIVEQYHKTK